jgi:hypothetical protein
MARPRPASATRHNPGAPGTPDADPGCKVASSRGFRPAQSGRGDDRDQPVSVSAQGRGELAACCLGNPVRELATVRGQVRGVADVSGCPAQQCRREHDLCRITGLPRRSRGSDLTERRQRLSVSGDDVAKAIRRLVSRADLHCLSQGSDDDPSEDTRQRNCPWHLHQIGAWLFTGELEQHPPRHVPDGLAVEVLASSRLGDPLARSLGELAYERNPGFRRFLERTNLPVKPHVHFRKADLDDRQTLYGQLAEHIWNPGRLEAAAVGSDT